MPERSYHGKYLHSTDDAILFLPNGWEEGEETWLPKSQIDWFDALSELERNDDIELLIPDWLAENKGLL